MENRVRELALFNLGIDSKLRGCDLVALKVRDICHGDQVASRAVDAAQDPAARSVRDHAARAASCKSNGAVLHTAVTRGSAGRRP
jgi:hypothetical protein